jgi:tRNA(fMet)-specific endonuclease VapC
MKLKYLLDTNVISELLYGCLRLPESKKRQTLLNSINKSALSRPVLDYDSKAAQCHAQERARLSKIGKTLAFADGQIAGIASSNDLILVTNNVADFQYFESLEIENWFQSEGNP